MKNIVPSIMISLLVSGCDKSHQSEDTFVQLSEKSCVLYNESAFKPVLPAEWQQYLAATRVCPLAKKNTDKAAITLISVFIEDYYRNKPMDAAWENFPKPILFDRKGLQVGKLEELYPEQSPGLMVMTYGVWQQDMPTIIRIHIKHPGVAGDYDYPELHWNKNKKQYEPHVEQSN